MCNVQCLSRHQTVRSRMTTTKQLLITNREAVRAAFKKSNKDVENDIQIIKGWFETQPHLPEVPSDNLIEMFLSINKFSIENTKQKLDMYYTIRSLIPEIYNNYNPGLPHMKDVPYTMGNFTPLPKLTKDFYRVFVFKIKGSAEEFDAYKMLAYCLSIFEVRMQYDASLGDIYVVDYENLKMGHVTKMHPVFFKNVSIVLERVFSNRIKGMHLINYPPFVDIILTVLKGVLKPKLVSRIKLHKTLDELYEYVPRDIMPADYGGEEISTGELNELWIKYLAEHSDRFEKLDKMKVNEDLRPTPLENDEILGYHGNFKKLDVD